MKKNQSNLIFFALLTLFSLNSFSAPCPDGTPEGTYWKANWGFIPRVFKKEKWQSSYIHNFCASFEAWSHPGELEAKRLGLDRVAISPEYIEYRFGATKIQGEVIFFEGLLSTSQKLQLRAEAKKAEVINLIQPNSPNQNDLQKEANCLALSVVDGQVQGCGDVWQGGLLNSELACFRGNTYIKCHLDCMKKIYNNEELQYTEGSCRDQ